MRIIYKPSGKVPATTWVLLPIALIATAALGVAYEYALLLNPFGVANVLIAGLGIFVFGATSVLYFRLAKSRNWGISALVGLTLAAVFLAATFWTIWQHKNDWGSGSLGLDEALTKRRSDGVRLLASMMDWRATGVWMWLLWIVEGLLAFATGLVTGGVESERPFCESCSTWARHGTWKIDVANPTDGAIATIQKATTFADYFVVPAGGPSSARKLRYRVGTCRCTRMATLRIDEVRKDSSGEVLTAVVDDVQLDRRGVDLLFDWAEKIDPRLAGQRPKVEVAEVKHEPFTPRVEYLPNGEHVTVRRANRGPSMLADNTYTRALRERLMANDFESAEEALRSQRSAEDLAFVAEACADWRERPFWFEAWEAHRPNSAALHLVRGLHGVFWAWQARGGGWVPKNVPTFMQRLQDAEADLYKAADLAPKDPTAWAALVRSARGLQHPKDEAKRRLEEAHRRAKFHTMAHASMLQYLCAKWFGSHEEMFAFARSTSDAAQPGAGVHALIVEAHFEFAGAGIREKKFKEEDYWSDPKVASEVLRAHQKCFHAGAFKPTMETPRVRTWFAFALWKAKEKAAAAEHLALMSDASTWGVFNGPIRIPPFSRHTVAAARRACGVASSPQPMAKNTARSGE